MGFKFDVMLTLESHEHAMNVTIITEDLSMNYDKSRTYSDFSFMVPSSDWQPGKYMTRVMIT